MSSSLMTSVAPVARIEAMSCARLTDEVVNLINIKSAQHLVINAVDERVGVLEQKHLQEEEEKEPAEVTRLNVTLVQAKIEIAQGANALSQAKSEIIRMQTIVDQMKDALTHAKSENVQSKTETAQAKTEATHAKKALKGFMEIYIFTL